MTAVDISNVAKVYSGKRGCMCGCNGKWSYNEGVSRHSWQGDVSVRSVKIIAGKVLRDANVKRDENANCAYVETDSRILAVYFK